VSVACRQKDFYAHHKDGNPWWLRFRVFVENGIVEVKGGARWRNWVIGERLVAWSEILHLLKEIYVWLV